jgi:hypothetical protein
MITIEHDRNRDRIVVRASGVLSARDYQYAIPEIEHAMELSKGPLRVMLRLEDFHGWEIGALWRELKFDLGHRGEFGRIAVIGETDLEEWGTTLAAPFAKAEMRFFPISREAEADDWLSEEGAAA